MGKLWQEAPEEPTEEYPFERNGPRAYDYFMEAHKQGHTHASFALGNYLLHPKKAKNGDKMTEAYNYLVEAADKGHTLSMYYLGLMHSMGMGTY